MKHARFKPHACVGAHVKPLSETELEGSWQAGGVEVTDGSHHSHQDRNIGPIKTIPWHPPLVGSYPTPTPLSSLRNRDRVADRENHIA